nr:uncharacterized protein LOC111421497 [Onthophagus taurus]
MSSKLVFFFVAFFAIAAFANAEDEELYKALVNVQTALEQHGSKLDKSTISVICGGVNMVCKMFCPASYNSDDIHSLEYYLSLAHNIINEMKNNGLNIDDHALNVLNGFQNVVNEYYLSLSKFDWCKICDVTNQLCSAITKE